MNHKVCDQGISFSKAELLAELAKNKSSEDFEKTFDSIDKNNDSTLDCNEIYYTSGSKAQDLLNKLQEGRYKTQIKDIRKTQDEALENLMLAP